MVIITIPIIGKEYKLYFLGGQSNMTGYGYNIHLPDDVNLKLNNVMIFEGNSTDDYKPAKGLGFWEKLQPGHGIGFSSNGKINNHSDRFGLELSFGKQISQLFGDTSIAIIKYAKNGSSIDASSAGEFGCWEPDFKDSNGINQYDHFLATLSNALNVRDIDNDGEEDILIPAGIIWMQGESDATNSYDVAKNYSNNLAKLISLIRAALRNSDLPVVLGRISDSYLGDNEDERVWKYGQIIRLEQTHYVYNDKNAYLVTTTDNYSYSDKWHYNSEAYIDLGIQFAKAIYSLESLNRSKILK